MDFQEEKMKSKISLALIFLTLAMGMAGCTDQVLTKDADAQPDAGPNQVYLREVSQEVVRYDCGHNIISDQIETVQAPTQQVTIPPYDAAASFIDSDFTDEQTGSQPLLVSNFDTFQVDHSYGALNMHVTDGINVIDYNFYTCNQWSTDSSGNQTCAAASISEQGTVTLDVTYSEASLSDVETVTECDPSLPPSS
jgi:hypothetical protein